MNKKINHITLLACLVFALLSTYSYAQKPAKVKTLKLNLQELPKGVSFTGGVVYSARWKDKAGEHLFIASESGIQTAADSAGTEIRSAFFEARHYLISDSTTLTWMESDSVTGCQLNADAGFVPGQFNVTDMDKDGVAEVWMMMRTACHNDKSPANLQLVIHEREERYSMIGTEKTRLSKDDVIGGEFQVNNTFKEGQELFLKKAQQVWHLYAKTS